MNRIKIEIVTYTEYLAPIKTIRTIVFQEEQAIAPELEFDGLDHNATHLLAYLDGKPVGTARIRSLDEKLGFTQVGEVFNEAGIPHLKMSKQLDLSSVKEE